MKRQLTQITTITGLSLLVFCATSASAAIITPTGADFEFSLGQAGITNANNRHIGGNAYDGKPDTFRSLGKGGRAVFDFGQAFTGPVTIWETSFGCINNGNICTNYSESLEIYAGNTWNGNFSSIDLTSTDWTPLGSLGNGAAQDGGVVNTSGTYSYLLLVDRSNTQDGFDVREVQASPVPVPAAVWLFGSALLGMLGFARRTKL